MFVCFVGRAERKFGLRYVLVEKILRGSPKSLVSVVEMEGHKLERYLIDRLNTNLYLIEWEVVVKVTQE